MKRHLILAAGGAGAVVIAVVLGLWPRHAETNGVTFQCGSALRPKQARDAYKSTEDPGGFGLIVVHAVDEACEAARSGTTNAGRVAWFIGIGGLLAAAVTRPRRPEPA